MPIEENNVSFTYDLDELLEDVPAEDREDAAYDAGEAALGAVKSYMAKQVSPVKGQYKRFAALSKDYKKIKQKVAGNKKANLKLYGDLDESMEVEADDGSFTISIRPDNTAKAYNHNVGETVPQRQFLPDDTNGETFKRNVVAKIKEQIAKYKKPRQRRQPEAQPVEIGISLDQIFKELRATKREQDIVKNVTKVTFKDIL